MSTALVSPNADPEAAAAIGTNLADFAAGDGVTDDTANINRAIAATPPAGVLWVPNRKYLTAGGHVLDSVTVRGPGRVDPFWGPACFYLKNGSNADMFTIAGPSTTIRDLALYGNKAQQSAQSRGIVFSPTVASNYAMLDNLWVSSFFSDNIVLSTPSTSLGATLRAIDSRLAGGFGISLLPGAADCEISDSFFDQNALSGVAVQATSSSWNNVHVWGNGTATSGSNRDGITLIDSNARGTRLVNCYIESQANGYGVRTAASNIENLILEGSTIWKNFANGVYLFSAHGCVLLGNRIWQNNQHGVSTYAGAGVLLDGTCDGIATVGNVLGYATSPGQSYGYAENGTTHVRCTAVGNASPAAWATVGGMLFPSGSTTVQSGNVT